MSMLKPGTLCMTVGGSGENASRIVVVRAFSGPFAFDPKIKDGYSIETANRVPFASVILYSRNGPQVSLRNTESEYIAERSNLRPLIGPDGKRLSLRRKRKSRGSVRTTELSVCAPALEANA